MIQTALKDKIKTLATLHKLCTEYVSTVFSTEQRPFSFLDRKRAKIHGEIKSLLEIPTDSKDYSELCNILHGLDEHIGLPVRELDDSEATYYGALLADMLLKRWGD